MSEVLIIQNITREKPGLLARVLEAEDISYEVVDLDSKEALPSIEQYRALVVLGGPDSASDDTQKMHKELDYVKETIRRGVPYLGICLGLQVLVKATGGNVVPGDVKEIGFINPDGDQHTVQITAKGRDDPLLKDFSEQLDVFQLHGETVELTDEMTLLASGKFCENQIVRVGANAYGIQSHFELTPEMLEVWATEDPDLIPIGNSRLQSDFKDIYDSYSSTGERLLRNFLRIAKLIN